MILPNEVPHGRPLSDLTQAVNQLIRYCRSITPRPSATIGVSTLANGTTFSAKVPQAIRGSVAVGDSSPWAFEATAERDANHEGKFKVTVRGGTAQAVGGNPAVFPSLATTNISNGEYFYIRFLLWDNSFAPVCRWHTTNAQDTSGTTGRIEHGQSLPTPSGNARSIVLVLCRVDMNEPGFIVQYRAGAIDIDATLAAGVAGSGITVRTISS